MWLVVDTVSGALGEPEILDPWELRGDVDAAYLLSSHFPTEPVVVGFWFWYGGRWSSTQVIWGSGEFGTVWRRF